MRHGLVQMNHDLLVLAQSWKHSLRLHVLHLLVTLREHSFVALELFLEYSRLSEVVLNQRLFRLAYFLQGLILRGQILWSQNTCHFVLTRTFVRERWQPS